MVLIVFGAGLFIAGSIWFLRAPQLRPELPAQPVPKSRVASGGTPAESKPAGTETTAAALNPPDTILFPASNGDVTFDHKKHYERVNENCSACHPKVFPQARQPLNYKKASHRASEASLTSCAYCHAVGGTSFAADSNCLKCHVKDYSKH